MGVVGIGMGGVIGMGVGGIGMMAINSGTELAFRGLLVGCDP